MSDGEIMQNLKVMSTQERQFSVAQNAPKLC